MKTTRERAEEKRQEKLELDSPAAGERLAGDPPDDSGGAPAVPAAACTTTARPAMTDTDREGLVARIRQIRRLTPAGDRSKADTEQLPADRLRGLETRVAHLERMVEGLQDSVHRESERHARLIAELQAQVDPEAMSAALADDARSRGL